MRAIESGETWYSQFSLFHEKGRFRTTNYRRGNLLPINSAVKPLAVSSRSVTVEIVDTGERLVVDNVPKHSRVAMAEYLDMIFRPTQVDLSAYSDDERGAIERGEVMVGMNRDAVLAALGPPPAHQTPTLEASQWRYWSWRVKTFLVLFGEDGLVREIRN